jgi:membrane protease YdiL (CAAX protease family)
VQAAASTKRPARPGSGVQPPGEQPPGSDPGGPTPPDPLPARPPGWPALVAYAATFLIALVSSTMLVFVVALVKTGGQRARLQAVAYEFALSAPGLMAGAFVNAAVLGAAALVAARWQRGGRARGGDEVDPPGPRTSVSARLRLGPTRASPLGLLATAAGLVGLNFATSTVSELLRVRGTGVMDVLAQSLQGPTVGRFVAALLTIGVAPGVAEEAFFRGYLQTRLTASWGRWLAIVVTAAAFGLIHLDPVQGSLVFLAGLFLGWVVERLGGVRPSILAHVTNNVIFVAIAAFGSGAPSSPGVQIAVIVGGTCVWLAAVGVLRSSRALAA